MKKDDLPRYYFTGRITAFADSSPKTDKKPMSFFRKHKFITILLILFGILFAGRVIFGATIFSDDFNAYTDGDLNGQGSWSGDTSFDVQDTTKFEGNKGVSAASTAGQVGISKASGSVASGTIGVYIQADSLYTDGNIYPLHVQEGGTWTSYWAAGGASNQIDFLGVDTTKHLTVGKWFWIQTSWRSSPSHQVEARIYDVEAGTWTTIDWQAPGQDWTSGNDTVYVYTNFPSTAHTLYFDYFAETKYEVPGGGTATTTVNNSKMLAFSGLGAFFVVLFDILRRILV